MSEPNFRDPEHWKPTALSPAEQQVAIKAFRRKVPRSERCQAPEQGPIRRVPYADRQVALIKAYRSTTGEILLGEKLNDKGANCEFFEDEIFYNYWFVVKGSRIRSIDAGNPMDAADLAGTGESEWVFMTSHGEAGFGYKLFYDDFSKSVEFTWGLH